MKRKLTERDYITLKLMVNGGATLEQLQNFHPISGETLRRIKRTSTFEEYRELQLYYAKQSIERRRAAQEAQEANETAETVEPATAEQVTIDQLTDAPAVEAKLDKAIDLLAGISEKLALIIDDLYGVKTGVDTDAKPNH